MTEFYTVKRIDNSRLVRLVAPHLWRDWCRLVGLGVALTAGVLLYAWQHFQYLQLGYRLEELKAERSEAAELNQQLHLEVAALRSPMRVDAIARNQLGLTVPLPGQVAPADAAGRGGAEVAQARGGVAPLPR